MSIIEGIIGAFAKVTPTCGVKGCSAKGVKGCPSCSRVVCSTHLLLTLQAPPQMRCARCIAADVAELRKQAKGETDAQS